jgi:hypothetical protein
MQEAKLKAGVTGPTAAPCICALCPPHSGSPAFRREPFILSIYSGWKQYMR